MVARLAKLMRLVLGKGGWPARILFLLIVSNGVLAPIRVWLLRNVIDTAVNRGAGTPGLAATVPWVVGLVLVLLLYNLRELAEQILKIGLTHRLRDYLSPIIAQKAMNTQYWCFEDSQTRDLMSRVGNSPENQFAQIFWMILFLPSYAVTLIGYAVIFLDAGWWLLPAVVALSLPALKLGLRHSTESYFLSRSQTKEGRMAGYLSSLITGRGTVKEVRLFRLGPYLQAKWLSISRKLVEERLSLSLRQQKKQVLIDGASVILTFGSVGVFVLSASRGAMTYGQFVSLCGALSGIVTMMVWHIPYSISQLNQQAMYWSEYEAFLALPEIGCHGAVESRWEMNDCIEFHDVCFKYPKTDGAVLRGVSFRVNKGDTVAIVGRNGAGKSTIIKLLLGLYRPDSGTITVDGRSLDTLSQESRRRLFSAVFQDFCTYSLTARENIGFGNTRRLSDDRAILTAAEKGMAAGILRDLPDGLDTYLGRVYQEGADLSVGQWQRMAISRACMAESEVIILDEPTAALDPLSEAELYENFAKAADDKTCILISHRLGSARMADRIIVIEDGKVVEEGSHSELMKAKGLYFSMFEAQAEWYREKEEETA